MMQTGFNTAMLNDCDILNQSHLLLTWALAKTSTVWFPNVFYAIYYHGWEVDKNFLLQNTQHCCSCILAKCSCSLNISRIRKTAVPKYIIAPLHSQVWHKATIFYFNYFLPFQLQMNKHRYFVIPLMNHITLVITFTPKWNWKAPKRKTPGIKMIKVDIIFLHGSQWLKMQTALELHQNINVNFLFLGPDETFLIDPPVESL